METIFALSTRPGKAGIAVIRLSGAKSIAALQQLVKDEVSLLQPRVMYYKKLYQPETSEIIDQAMIVIFEAPHSFTGEDMVELHLHGSIAIINIIIAALLRIQGLRLAEPGEFSRRAFLNGKMDLTAAEGLADLIDAETAMQARQAIKQAEGGLEKLYNEWHNNLLSTISLLEAYIDFPDEEIPEAAIIEVVGLVKMMKNSIQNHLNDNRRGERLRNGIKLAILGHPNVGKSSLLNFLLRREVAIVSSQAGTTRDVIEGHLDVAGYPVIIQDTAGIRESRDAIEQEGIKRSINTALNSDIKIILMEASDLTLGQELIDLIDHHSILVINKIDLYSPKADQIIYGKQPLWISLKSNIGVEQVLTAIEHIAAEIACPTELPNITRLRHRAGLEQAKIALDNFSITNDLVLAAEDIRIAMRSLNNITGKISVDEILGEIFSNFCIGK